MNHTTPICWPAVACYRDQPELEAVENPRTLSTLTATAPFTLIDYTGNRFEVQPEDNDLAVRKIESITIDHLVTLARAHMAALGHCCVSKFHATSAAEIIDTVIQLDD